MPLHRWLIRNWADTNETLAPLVLPRPLAEAMSHVEQVLAKLPRWHLEEADHAAGTVHATRRTLLFRFVDDIHLRLEEQDGHTTVHAHSQSRVGKGDLGQNERNLRELFQALQCP